MRQDRRDEMSWTIVVGVRVDQRLLGVADRGGHVRTLPGRLSPVPRQHVLWHAGGSSAGGRAAAGFRRLQLALLLDGRRRPLLSARSAARPVLRRRHQLRPSRHGQQPHSHRFTPLPPLLRFFHFFVFSFLPIFLSVYDVQCGRLCAHNVSF